MSNTLVTPVLVADMMLDYMDNELPLAGRVNRQYEGEFRGGKGATIEVRKPPRFTAQDGPVISTVQDINQGTVAVTVDTWKTVPIKLTGWDRSLSKSALQNFGDTILKPAASILANEVELALMARYNEIANWSGTAGDPPDSYADVAAVRKIMTYNAVPGSDRTLALTPAAYADLGSAVAALYNPQGPVGKQVTTGMVPNVAGFDIIESVNCPTHTVGSHGGTPLVNGASQVGSSLVTDGWTSGSVTLTQGDTFTVAGVYMINPVTKQSTGQLQTFVVTQETSDSSGDMTIPIYPSIITSGANQTVSGSPADNAAITMKGTASTAYGQSIAFHKNAFGLVMVPPRPPEGLKSTVRTYKGYSIAISQGPDIMRYEEVWRADVLFGTVAYWPELACRVTD